MELTKAQDKFIRHKTSGYQVLKGKEGTGKSTASIYKALNLENNYCLYEDDKILFVTSNYVKNSNANELYNKESNNNYFYSLFSLERNRVNIVTFEELINTYYNAYLREKGQVFKIIDKKESLNVLQTLKNEIETFYKKSKFIEKATLDFLLDEISWIKASNLTIEEYLNVDRKGRKNRIKKNSYTRESIYIIKEMYNNK